MTESTLRSAMQVAAGMAAYQVQPATGARGLAEALQQWARRQAEAVSTAV